MEAEGYKIIFASDFLLTLIGMRGDTFTYLLVIFGSDFVSWILIKNFHFWRWKWTSIGLIWHPAKLFESYKNAPRWR